MIFNNNSTRGHTGSLLVYTIYALTYPSLTWLRIVDLIKYLLTKDNIGPTRVKNMNKNKKFIVDPNTNSYIIQIHQINQ